MTTLTKAASFSLTCLAAVWMLTSSVAMAAEEPKKAETPPAAPAASTAPAADAAKPADGTPKEATATDTSAGGKPSAYEKLKATEKGKLKNPLSGNADAIVEGKKRYLSYGCNGCHGGNGGGGMCPPLTNDTWVYDGDDDTLFRLVIQGSVELQKDGFARKRKEAVTGPMPGYKDIILNEEHMWQIITFIRSVWNGDPARNKW